MSLLTLLVHAAPTHKGKARPRRSGLSARRRALLLERLEGRCVPSIIEFGGLPAIGGPSDIVLGPDGNLWFTDTAEAIGRLNMATSTVDVFPTPTINSGPSDLTTGPDGNLWFTEIDANKIGRITMVGAITEFTVPTPKSTPIGITTGPDGDLWFTESSASKIGRITTAGIITAADEFPTPTASSDPGDITAGPDGKLWFTEDNAVGKIGRITTAGIITAADEFTIPTAGGHPLSITAGPDGNLWFTEFYDKIGRITTAGIITAADEFTIPTSNGLPGDIATGPDGNLWFTEANAKKIGRIATSGVFVSELGVPDGGPGSITAGPHDTMAFTVGNKLGLVHDVPSTGISEFGGLTPVSLPIAITLGPDGNFWFTEADSSKIGRLNAVTGAVAEFPTPTANSKPFGIAAGPDGNLWFTESVANKIGRISTAGTITGADEFTLPSGGLPVGITGGADGNLWFAAGDKIGRITTAGIITTADEFPTTTLDAQQITAGPDGNLWFTDGQADKIGRITTSGSVTEFTVPTADGSPSGITAGPDGNLWFTEEFGNKIGRITTAGIVTPADEFTVPTANSTPLEINAGPDGNLWFTETSANKIGQITTGGVITAEFSASTSGNGPAGIASGPRGMLAFTERGDKVGIVHDVPDADHRPPVQLAAFASVITHSREHFTQFVTNAYQQFLGRTPDNGLNGWVGAMQAGLTDEQLEAAFTSSGEYMAKYRGSQQAWVEGLYHDILGRTPAQSEVDSWVSKLFNGLLPQSLAFAFTASPEREGTRVRADFQTFLGRMAAQDEVDSWVNNMVGGLSNEDLVAGFLGSSVYYDSAAKGQGTNFGWITSATQDELGRPATTGEINNALIALLPVNLSQVANSITQSVGQYRLFVSNAYQAYLGRAPDIAGLNGWVSAMQNGLSDEHLEARFLGSGEYVAKHGGAGAGWVTGMYNDLLKRTPSAAEVQSWVNALNHGASTEMVAFGFAASVEREGMRVRNDYFTYLGRTPSQPEVDDWVNHFTHGLTNENLVADFIGSFEYYNAALKGKSDASDWVASAIGDVLQRAATTADFSIYGGGLQ